MSFNLVPTKQAQEVIFSRKANKIYHSPLVCNNSTVSTVIIPRKLGNILDTKLICGGHLKMVSLNINKALGNLRKLQNLLPRSSLITIYKAFVRPHLDYDDIVND